MTATLAMDKMWEAFAVPRTFSGFCKESIPPIDLKTDVSEDVKASFRIIRKLLEHSYFEYQFYDVATLKAMLTFEMAAKIRYQEITGEKWDGGSLNRLITWFDNKHYFEVSNKYFLRKYREFRNSLAHPKNSGYSGINKRQWIIHTLNLINALYEDPKLRYYRKNVVYTIGKKLTEIKKDGFTVSFGNTKLLCFEIALVFINNKLSPMELDFYFKPIFEIPDNFRSENKIYDSKIYRITANKFKILKDKVELCDASENITIAKIDNEENRNRFIEWRMIFREYSERVGEDLMWHSQTNELFEKHLKEFHFTNGN